MKTLLVSFLKERMIETVLEMLEGRFGRFASLVILYLSYLKDVASDLSLDIIRLRTGRKKLLRAIIKREEEKKRSNLRSFLHGGLSSCRNLSKSSLKSYRGQRC